MSKPLYKVTFLNAGKVYELYARNVASGALWGFTEVSELVFDVHDGLVIDPTEERLRDEFGNTRALHLPMHSIVRVEEVERKGQSAIRDASTGEKVVTPFPLPGKPRQARRDKLGVMKRLERPILAIALLVGATACDPQSEMTSASRTEAPPATPAAVVPSTEAASNAFDVEVTLTPAARERLVSQHESLIVSAEYFGYPSEEAEAQHVPGSENPWLTLHRAQVVLEGEQLRQASTASFAPVAFDPKQLAWTNAPDAPQVNINVFSGRRSSADNLLECGMFQDALAVAMRAPVRVSCGLIGEALR